MTSFPSNQVGEAHIFQRLTQRLTQKLTQKFIDYMRGIAELAAQKVAIEVLAAQKVAIEVLAVLRSSEFEKSNKRRKTKTTDGECAFFVGFRLRRASFF